jgi:hypothetical protein
MIGLPPAATQTQAHPVDEKMLQIVTNATGRIELLQYRSNAP